MKKLNVLMCGLLLGGLVFTGCSDDDDKGGNAEGTEAAVVAHEYGEWTYFNFADGATKTLPIQKKEGAVTGLYTGDLKGTGMFASFSQEGVSVSVSRVSADSVDVEFMDLTLSMSEEPAEPFTLTTRAEAKLVGDKWELTSVESETLVGEMLYKFSFTGTIGTTKGAEVNLACEMTPGAMPMPITMTYISEVADSYTYEVDADEESALTWDIAVHKYNMRTNNGLVKKLDTKNFDAVTVGNVPADEEMVADTDGSVMADMSNMMNGFVGYQSVKLNKELGGWVTATPTGTMPPYTYELNDNVFVVKVNGKVWKMQFNAYTYGGRTAAKFVYGEVE